MKARAFWIIGPSQGAIREAELAPAGPGETRVHTLASGISRGTEALVFRGAVPPSQYHAMRAPLMAGDFPWPVKYGYSAIGMTESGERVFVLHPHQDVFVAPTAMCIPVPDAVPTARAALAANMETALNLVWDAQPLPGEHIMVVGAGVLGLLAAALLARIPAAVVTVCDILPARRLLAERLGCRFAAPAVAPGEQDLIVHTSASEAGLRLALGCAAFEARIIEASWFGTAAPALPLGEDFNSRRLRIVSSQVSVVATSMRRRRSPAQRLALALDLLADPVFDALLEPPTCFDALPTAMPELLAGGLCHVITYGEGPCSV